MIKDGMTIITIITIGKRKEKRETKTIASYNSEYDTQNRHRTNGDLEKTMFTVLGLIKVFKILGIPQYSMQIHLYLCKNKYILALTQLFWLICAKPNLLREDYRL